MAIKQLHQSSRWSIERVTGFKNRKNLWYYTLLSGISLAFIKWMSRSIFVKSIYCNPNDPSFTPPAGECYWYMQPGSRYYWGIQIHLLTCLPALGLAVLQFNPKIRQAYPKFHRYAGRLSMVLAILATLSVLLFVDVAMGGQTTIYLATFYMTSMSLIGHYKGWTSIRAGQIHIHRRWMLRTWACLGAIITMRPLLFIVVPLISRIRSMLPLSMEIPCEKLLEIAMLGQSRRPAERINIFEKYPMDCLRLDLSPANITLLHSKIQASLLATNRSIPQEALEALRPGGAAIVQATLSSRRLDQMIAAVSMSFGPATLVALLIHTVLVENYLVRTKDEDDRLKRVSELRMRSRAPTPQVNHRDTPIFEKKSS